MFGYEAIILRKKLKTAVRVGQLSKYWWMRIVSQQRSTAPVLDNVDRSHRTKLLLYFSRPNRWYFWKLLDETNRLLWSNGGHRRLNGFCHYCQSTHQGPASSSSRPKRTRVGQLHISKRNHNRLFTVLLTLWRPLLPYGYSYKVFRAWPG